MPLVGDKKYGAKDDFYRPALHAFRLSFEHPVRHEPMVFVEPLPEELLFGLKGASLPKLEKLGKILAAVDVKTGA